MSTHIHTKIGVEFGAVIIVLVVGTAAVVPAVFAGVSTATTYVIERNIPGAGSITDREWAEASTLSNQTIADIGGARGCTATSTFDKVYCVYEADNEDLLREHGRRCDFAVDRVAEACRIIDPTTAGARV